MQSARRRYRPAPIALAAVVVVLLTSRMLVPFSVPVTGRSAVPFAAPPRVAELEAAPPPLTTPAASQSPRVRSSSRVRSNPQTALRLEVLVPPDQEIALRQWLNGLRLARQPELVVATQTLPAVTLVAISPIHIEPIPTSQLPGLGKEPLMDIHSTSRLRSTVFAALVMLASSTPLQGAAQTATPAPGQVAAAPQFKTPVPLKVDVVISRFLNDKKVSSAPFTLWVSALDPKIGSQYVSIRMGIDVPIGSRTETVPNRSAGRRPRRPSNPSIAMSVPSIDCRATLEDDGRFGVEVRCAIVDLRRRRRREGGAERHRSIGLPLLHDEQQAERAIRTGR